MIENSRGELRQNVLTPGKFRCGVFCLLFPWTRGSDPCTLNGCSSQPLSCFSRVIRFITSWRLSQAVIARSKAIVLFPLVLKDMFVQIARAPDVVRMTAAGHRAGCDGCGMAGSPAAG
jgi:hypothetical protein